MMRQMASQSDGVPSAFFYGEGCKELLLCLTRALNWGESVGGTDINLRIVALRTGGAIHSWLHCEHDPATFHSLILDGSVKTAA